jgi:hypothetical protein
MDTPITISDRDKPRAQSHHLTLLLKLASFDVDWPDNENRVHGKR